MPEVAVIGKIFVLAIQKWHYSKRRLKQQDMALRQMVKDSVAFVVRMQLVLTNLIVEAESFTVVREILELSAMHAVE
jgi:hypothetical protein